MNLEETVVPICLARKQALELKFCSAVAKRAEGGFGFCYDFFITLRLTELNKFELVGKFIFDFAADIDRGFKPCTLFQDSLSLFRFVPKRRICGLLAQRLEAFKSIFPVKDASLAAQATA